MGARATHRPLQREPECPCPLTAVYISRCPDSALRDGATRLGQRCISPVADADRPPHRHGLIHARVRDYLARAHLPCRHRAAWHRGGRRGLDLRT